MVHSSPLVTVILPIYNVEKYLREGVDSVLKQTYPHLEILLIDDGSSDGSGAICDAYAEADERVKVIHQSNAGVSVARNRGLDLAQGDFVAFLDPDDYWDKRMVELCLAEFDRHPDTDVVDTHCLEFNLEGKALRNVPKEGLSYTLSGEALRRAIIVDWENVPDKACGKLFRREAIGTLRFQLNRRSEDYLFHRHFYGRGKDYTLRLIPDVLYFYRLGDPNSLSMMTQQGEKSVMRERMVEEGMADIYAALEQEQSPHLHFILNEWMAWALDRLIYLGKIYRTEPKRHDEVAQRQANLYAFIAKGRSLSAFSQLSFSQRLFARSPQRFTSIYRWAIAIGSRLGFDVEKWYRQNYLLR